MERKVKAAYLSGIYLAAFGAAIVMVNIIACSLNQRIDFTRSERFTLAKGSKNLVRKLKDEMTVDFYVTRSLPKQEVFVRDVMELLDEYEEASKGDDKKPKFRYRILEPKTDEERKEASEAGLREAAAVEGSTTGDQATIARGFMGMLFKYGEAQATIPLLVPEQDQGLEFWISSKIREVRDKSEERKQKIGVITGKDEIKLTDQNLVPPQMGKHSIKSILQNALPGYEIVEVDLEGGAAELDDELRGLIITQPGKDYTEKELRKIDEFVMQGNKSLFVVAGAVNMKANDANMEAELDLHGLEKLLSGYGIEMKKEAVLDYGRSMALPVVVQGSRMAWIRALGVVQAQNDARLDEDEQLIDNSFLGFFRLGELSFPFPSTLVVDEKKAKEKQPNAEIKVVARSSPNSTADKAEKINMKPRIEWKKAAEFGQRDIAVVVEGTIKSAFGPKAEGDSKKAAPAQSKKPSRILVISAPQFLANPFARAGNPPPMPPQMAMMGSFGGDRNLQEISLVYARKYLTNNILALKNILDWMAGDHDLIAVSAKILGDPNLTYSDIDPPKIDPSEDTEQARAKREEEIQLERERVQERVQWAVTLVPPVVFAIFGVIRWRRREGRRDKISLS